MIIIGIAIFIVITLINAIGDFNQQNKATQKQLELARKINKIKGIKP